MATYRRLASSGLMRPPFCFSGGSELFGMAATTPSALVWTAILASPTGTFSALYVPSSLISARTLCPPDPAKMTCPPLTGPFWYVTFPVTVATGLPQPASQGTVARTRSPAPLHHEKRMTDPSTGVDESRRGRRVARAAFLFTND